VDNESFYDTKKHPMTCPCDPNNTYENCCSIAHKNIKAVKTAHQLMRSRYSAFVMGNIDYLQRSHHSTQRPSRKEALEIEQWSKTVKWLELEIVQTTLGVEKDFMGTVEFKAFYIENNQEEVLHEHSRFCKENGHWVYVDAI
jgi:SEC-C motif-containing protein